MADLRRFGHRRWPSRNAGIDVRISRPGRPAARAKVRECLADTEDTRWLDADYQEFRKALSRLDSAALIAKFDRSLIHRYTYLAEVAHYTEVTKRVENPHFPPRSLPLELAVLLEGVVATIANEAWRPRLWRFRKKRFLWVIDQTIRARRVEHPEWSWNATLFRPALMATEPGMKAALRRAISAYTGRIRISENESSPSEPAA